MNTDTARLRTALRSGIAGAALSALVGCSSSSTLLAPPPTTGSLAAKPAAQPAPGAAAEQVRLQAAIKNCPTTAEPAKNIGVAAMLEQARLADAKKAPPALMTKAESDCLAARVKLQLIETSGPSASPPTAAATVAAVAPAKANELTIDFESETVSPKDKRAIADLVAAKKGSPASKIRILAGRGGGGNMFDQAVIAHKRAQRVKELLPPGMVKSVEFDPTQVDDTVRIEFTDRS